MLKIKSGMTLNYHRKYFSTFQQHNINLRRFLILLNKQTLKSFGVINESHRMVIIINICIKYIQRFFNNTTERKKKIMDEIGQLTFKNYTDYLVTIMEETPTDHHITSHVNVLVNNNDDPAPSVTHKNNNELPSYFDVVKNNKQELNYITIHEEEGCEILPSYSCSVFKAGYVYKKDEMISQGVKAKRRTWRKFYFYLWGTLLRIYKNEPLDINCAVPIREFGMERAKINLAIDYTKRRNVLRVLLSTGYQFIFQVDCRNDCISWIENFQSSVNISSSIDDREMPMFITLPMRRQRGVNILPIIPNNVINEIGGSNLNNRNNNCIYNSSFSEIVGDRYSIAITTTNGLIYEAFERITRELQQVQIDASPNQQLIW